MKKTLTVLWLSSALAALMAQSAGSPQNHVKFMTAQLGLTAEQQSQATTIFTNAQTTGSTLRASMKIAHQGLNDAVKSNNTVGIEQLAATVGNLTAQLTLAQSKAKAQFYQILTADQRAKLDQLESQHWGGFRRGSRASAQ